MKHPHFARLMSPLLPPFLAAVLTLGAAPMAQAQDDPRLRTISYRPGTVYTLRVPPGYVATIVLNPDERIESVATGNSSAWELTPSKSGNHLFVRPNAAGATTNAEVITDSRSYTFILQTAYDGDPEAVFQLRFSYGDPKVVAPVAAPAGADGTDPAPTAPAATMPAVAAIAQYRISGERDARPLAVSDDGRTTLFTFAEDVPLPAIYAIDEQGHETLVTMRADERGWAVDRIWPRYVLRLDEAKAQVVRDPGKRRP